MVFISILQGAVQTLSLIQELLVPVVTINCQLHSQETDSSVTTTNHSVMVESEHPYKPATVANYKVFLCTEFYVAETEILSWQTKSSSEASIFLVLYGTRSLLRPCEQIEEHSVWFRRRSLKMPLAQLAV